MAFLEIRLLSKFFGRVVALEAVDLSIAQGGVFSVIGPNGSGKTTLFNCITGVYPPDGGEVRFEGKLLNGTKAHERTALGKQGSRSTAVSFVVYRRYHADREQGHTCHTREPLLWSTEEKSRQDQLKKPGAIVCPDGHSIGWSIWR